MKKKVIGSVKVLVFLLGFCLIFLQIQKVLHYRWDFHTYSANLYMKEQPEDAYDVIFLGSSDLKTAVYPLAMFQTNGITSYNCAVTDNAAAFPVYYLLEYLLRYQNPKVVCCDFSALYDEKLPSDRETPYRKAVETMPDRDLRWKMIKDIHEIDPEQSALSYLFPMLRYHNIWNELEEENFEKDYVYHDLYEDYDNGCSLINGTYEEKAPYDISPAMWEAEPSEEPLSALNVEWYDKMIALCQEKDIRVAAVFPPSLGESYDHAARWETTKAYLESRGVDIIDYNNYDAVHRIELNVATDYIDDTHMSYRGSLKLSPDLAYILYDRYGIPDRRGTEEAAQWEAQWNAFCEDYDIEEAN